MSRCNSSIFHGGVPESLHTVMKLRTNTIKNTGCDQREIFHIKVYNTQSISLHFILIQATLLSIAVLLMVALLSEVLSMSAVEILIVELSVAEILMVAFSTAAVELSAVSILRETSTNLTMGFSVEFLSTGSPRQCCYLS